MNISEIDLLHTADEYHDSEYSSIFSLMLLKGKHQSLGAVALYGLSVFSIHIDEL